MIKTHWNSHIGLDRLSKGWSVELGGPICVDSTGTALYRPHVLDGDGRVVSESPFAYKQDEAQYAMDNTAVAIRGALGR